MMRDYYRMLIEEGNPEAAGKMKQFATYFSHGVRDGAQLRAAVHQARTAEEIIARVDEFFSAKAATA
jgi:tRNA-dihydrouridine synthase